MYTRFEIDEANSRDIVQVARELDLKLVRKGAHLFCKCVEHEDNNPSMQVGGSKNLCYCYSCEAAFNPIGLVMKVKKCGFREAVERLIGRAGGAAAKNGGRLGKASRLGEARRLEEASRQGEAAEARSATLFHLARKGEEAWLEAVEGDVVRTGLERFYPSMDNSLSRCLLRWFPREVVEGVTNRYVLGCWTDRMFVRGTMFPIIDREGRCHNIKVQEYETNADSPQHGHRKGGTVWLGKTLAGTGEVVLDNRVLFGEHLLRARGVVALVESPKNAVVGACWRPDLTWVAVGNKGMLTRQMLEPLRGRDVLVFPDRDALPDWRDKLSSLQDMANFVLSTYWMDEVGAKGDIADWIMKEKGESKGGAESGFVQETRGFVQRREINNSLI